MILHQRMRSGRISVTERVRLAAEHKVHIDVCLWQRVAYDVSKCQAVDARLKAHVCDRRAAVSFIIDGMAYVCGLDGGAT